MTPGVPLVAAALSAVLSSGLTAAYLRSTMPDTVPVEGAPVVTPETRPLASRLAEPAAPYRATSPGSTLDLGSVEGFARGWQRVWARGDEQLTSYVMEFGGTAQARSYAQGGTGRLAARFTSPEPFLIEGMPGVSGLSDTVRDSNGHYLHAVVMHRERFVALLLLVSDAARPGNVVGDVVHRQWDLLAP